MTKENSLAKPQTPHEAVALHEGFQKTLTENIEVALGGLSPKNRKEYEATLRMWSDFAHEQGLDQLNFDLICVKSFLTENAWSHNTRKVRLAHLRKFAELLALADDDNRYGYQSSFGRLALLKPKALGGKKVVHKSKELRHKEIYRVFDSYAGDSNKEKRNRAILGLMFLAGLRASEIVALKWENVDFDNRTLFIFEGKGEKSAHIPMLGDLYRILHEWLCCSDDNQATTYVICWITRGDNLRGVKKLSTKIINNLTKEIAEKTGISFRPHDARRTIIGELIRQGASIAEARDFARHSSGETTLRYAKKHDASKLGSRLYQKLKYGDVLGDMKADEQARYWECGNKHKFHAINPIECPKCYDTNLSFQTSLFD